MGFVIYSAHVFIDKCINGLRDSNAKLLTAKARFFSLYSFSRILDPLTPHSLQEGFPKAQVTDAVMYAAYLQYYTLSL